MEKKRSILNVAVAVSFKLLLLALTVVAKRLLIKICGNEANGLNALYLSIVGFLAVAELGVGNAITFCMYRPIVEGDTDKVSALYHLFRRLYLAVSGVMLAAGLLVLPILPALAGGYTGQEGELYFTFFIMLVSVVLSYMFGAKTSLINAYKDNYITTAITSGGMVLQQLMQIGVLLLTGSFSGYLICRIAAVCLQWAATDLIAGRRHGDIISNVQRVDGQTRTELLRNIKAMFMHKVGALLVNTADSIIISVFVGVAVLGKYSNYSTIAEQMFAVLVLLFSPLTSILGHRFIAEKRENTIASFEMFHLMNFAIGAVFYLGYYAVVDDLVAILFGGDLLMEKLIPTVLTLNGFVRFMRQSVLTFRDATGTFYYDRWKPVAEGVSNVILSVLLVRRFGAVGVIAATVVTSLLVCHVVEPFVLYKHAFGASPKKYYVRNYSLIAVFFAAVLLFDKIRMHLDNRWINLLANGCLSVLCSLVLIAAVMLVFRNKSAAADRLA